MRQTQRCQVEVLGNGGELLDHSCRAVVPVEAQLLQTSELLDGLDQIQAGGFLHDQRIERKVGDSAVLVPEQVLERLDLIELDVLK